MKKVFKLTAPNKTPERQTDSVKNEIRKYIARERRKALPEGVDFWDFDCQFGNDALSATVTHISEIIKKIDTTVLEKRDTFYVEILAKPGHRVTKKIPDKSDS